MGEDKGKYAYNYLLSKGISPIAASGIIGNLHAESRLDTRIGGKADNKGSIGIAQWHSERKQGLFNFAKRNGADPYGLTTQLDYLVDELKSPAYKKAYIGISNARTPDEAAVAFMNDFEKPAEWAKKQSVGQRVGMARSIFSGVPYENVNYQDNESYGVDTSLNLPMNTGDYQTAPDIASKEDLEAEQAKAELLQKQIQKQNEKNFLAEVQAQQEQDSQRRQQQEEQYQQQQQQDTGIDESYYQIPQIVLPEYIPPQQEQFQAGGFKYTVTGNNPIVIPPQGSYPLSYRDRGNTDTDGTLFSAAKKVSRVDENGKPLTRNQIAENQIMWNMQKQAYGPEQQAFNIWKNNEENTKQGYFIPEEYNELIKERNSQPDVARYEIRSAKDDRELAKESNRASGPGFFDSLNSLNPFKEKAGCIYTDEDKSGVKKQNGGLIKYQKAGRFKNQTGPMTTRDSVAHQADKILKYEVLRGGAGSAPLDGTNGNPDYRDPRYKKQLMDRIYPEVQKILPNASAIESAEAMDLIFNSGWDDAAGKIVIDPRAYALQEYYRKNDPSKLDENGAWAGRKNAPYSFDKEYANTVGKLSENQRRIFMNKGRDWFYQHRAPKNSSWDIKTQGPHPNYEDTWYGRIWNTNDYNEFNPNNPKFIKKEMGGEIEYPKNELDTYKDGGGIPERYKNMGFNRVGQKKEGDGQKKWKVLAKKGDKYKVVQGGYRGMQDFSQHGSKKRQDNFWSRMGGKDSAKANDPFSPLYWHKRLGKWEDGGVEGEESAKISPEARGMGDAGIRYGNSFSASLGANLQDKNIRTGIGYDNNNLAADINYTKGLDNTSSFNTNLSYNPGKYNLDFSYDKGPEGNKNLSIGTGYRGKNLSGKLIYDQSSEGKNLSGDVRYGKGNFSGSLGTDFRLEDDFNPNIRGDIRYKNKNLTTSIGANYNRDIGVQPNISAIYRFKKGGKIESKVECSNCGWSWNKSDSSEEDMYNCHKCGGQNTGNTKMQAGGLIKYQDGSTFIEGDTQNYSNLVEEVPVWGGSLDEVTITNNYKAPIVANKYPKFSEYREQPVEVVMDAVPELQKFAEKNMAKAVNYEEKIKKEEAVNTVVGQKNMKIRLSGKSTLEDTIENKDIDLSKYKTPEQAKKLQSFLVSQGYNLDPDSRIGNRGIDGKIGNITKLAVTKYNQHLATPGYESIKEGSGLLGKCTEEQCSEYGQNELYRNMQPEVSRDEWNKLTGLKGNAWDIGKNIIKAGGREVTTKKDGLRPGDVVTMYTGGHSEYQGEADRAGTGTTHTGIIDKVNPDGSYYILHNVHSGSKLTGFEGKEFRDLVKNNNVSTHNFTVKHAYRPAYDKVKKGEKKIVREDLVLRIDPLKQKKLSSGDYNNMFTSASAKDKLENTFLKSFNDTRNKKVFSKKFNLGDDEYNSLAKGSLGILGQEAAYATNPQYTTGAKEAVATIAKGIGYKKDEVSRGAGRLKYETNFGKDDLTELGINEDNFDDENNAGLVTMYKLATDYKNFLRQGDNKKDALYKAITVYNSSLGKETNGKTIKDFAKDYDVDYTNKVLNFSDMFDVTDNKKSYKTSSDELLLKPNVAKWNTKLKRQNKI